MCLQEKYPWIDTATSEDFPTEDLKLMASQKQLSGGLLEMIVFI